MSLILRNLAGAGEIEPSPGCEIKGFLKFSKLWKNFTQIGKNKFR